MPRRLTPRQRAGRLNQRKSKGITPEGRQRLSEAAKLIQPWQHATGPRTDAGKAASRWNAWRHGERAWTLLPSASRAWVQVVRGKATADDLADLGTIDEAIEGLPGLMGVRFLIRAMQQIQDEVFELERRRLVVDRVAPPPMQSGDLTTKQGGRSTKSSRHARGLATSPNPFAMAFCSQSIAMLPVPEMGSRSPLK